MQHVDEGTTKMVEPYTDLQIETFPWTVIESPMQSFHLENKFEMKVASKDLGGPLYGGPVRHWERRWEHIEVFYVLEPVELGVYIAGSLHDRFHYQVEKSEKVFLKWIESFCSKNRKSKLITIRAGENYKDDNIVVIHNPSTYLRNYILSFDNTDIIDELVCKSGLDKSRGNYRIDTGYTSGMSQTRDPKKASVSVPSVLARTMEPMFLRTMVEVSSVMDIVCQGYGLGPYFRVDAIDKSWARVLHANNLCQQIRNSLAVPRATFGGHLDTQNDPRPYMCPVPVVHRILHTKIGPARHAIIGYTRKSCHEADLRVKMLMPILETVGLWYNNLPDTRKVVSNELFSLPKSSSVPDAISFPVHCTKSVGLSPYIDGVIQIQKRFQLTKDHCVALCYSVVANESPHYFWEATRFYIRTSVDLKMLSPVLLGVQFHNRIWNLIKDKSLTNLPKRHQPHNGVQAADEKIEQSILALIKLVDAMAVVPETEKQKEFYHSKAIAILVRPTDKGGCYAAGGAN